MAITVTQLYDYIPEEEGQEFTAESQKKLWLEDPQKRKALINFYNKFSKLSENQKQKVDQAAKRKSKNENEIMPSELYGTIKNSFKAVVDDIKNQDFQEILINHRRDKALAKFLASELKPSKKLLRQAIQSDNDDYIKSAVLFTIANDKIETGSKLTKIMSNLSLNAIDPQLAIIMKEHSLKQENLISYSLPKDDNAARKLRKFTTIAAPLLFEYATPEQVGENNYRDLLARICAAAEFDPKKHLKQSAFKKLWRQIANWFTEKVFRKKPKFIIATEKYKKEVDGKTVKKTLQQKIIKKTKERQKLIKPISIEKVLLSHSDLNNSQKTAKITRELFEAQRQKRIEKNIGLPYPAIANKIIAMAKDNINLSPLVPFIENEKESNDKQSERNYPTFYLKELFDNNPNVTALTAARLEAARLEEQINELHKINKNIPSQLMEQSKALNTMLDKLEEKFKALEEEGKEKIETLEQEKGDLDLKLKEELEPEQGLLIDSSLQLNKLHNNIRNSEISNQFLKKYKSVKEYKKITKAFSNPDKVIYQAKDYEIFKISNRLSKQIAIKAEEKVFIIPLSDYKPADGIDIKGIPEGAHLSSGEYDNNKKIWHITNKQLQQIDFLKLTLPRDYSEGDFQIKIMYPSCNEFYCIEKDKKYLSAKKSGSASRAYPYNIKTGQYDINQPMTARKFDAKIVTKNDNQAELDPQQQARIKRMLEATSVLRKINYQLIKNNNSGRRPYHLIVTPVIPGIAPGVNLGSNIKKSYYLPQVIRELNLMDRLTATISLLDQLSKLHDKGYIHDDLSLKNLNFYNTDHAGRQTIGIHLTVTDNLQQVPQDPNELKKISKNTVNFKRDTIPPEYIKTETITAEEGKLTIRKILGHAGLKSNTFSSVPLIAAFLGAKNPMLNRNRKRYEIYEEHLKNKDYIDTPFKYKNVQYNLEGIMQGFGLPENLIKLTEAFVNRMQHSEYDERPDITQCLNFFTSLKNYILYNTFEAEKPYIFDNDDDDSKLKAQWEKLEKIADVKIKDQQIEENDKFQINETDLVPDQDNDNKEQATTSDSNNNSSLPFEPPPPPTFDRSPVKTSSDSNSNNSSLPFEPPPPPKFDRSPVKTSSDSNSNNSSLPFEAPPPLSRYSLFPERSQNESSYTDKTEGQTESNKQQQTTSNN